jgi:cytidylate kinase
MAEQVVRDERDRTRADSPLAKAPDAIELDTTGLTLDEVADRVVELVRRRQAPDRGGAESV